MPLAATKLGTAQNAFALEAGGLKRTLSRKVLDVGRGLDALDARVREQVVGEAA